MIDCCDTSVGVTGASFEDLLISFPVGLVTCGFLSCVITDPLGLLTSDPWDLVTFDPVGWVIFFWDWGSDPSS